MQLPDLITPGKKIRKIRPNSQPPTLAQLKLRKLSVMDLYDLYRGDILTPPAPRQRPETPRRAKRARR